MRLIHRRVLTVLVAVALVSSLAVLPSVASAAKSKSTPIQKLNKKVTAISKKLTTVANGLKNVTGTVNQGIPIITQLVSGVTQLKAGLTALQNGLTTLSAAVQNTTTGLPGLNAARSLIGVVAGGAAQAGSEFTVAGHAGNNYVLSFVNGATPPVATDVSKRIYEVMSANPAQAGTSSFSAANCSVAAISPTCAAVVGSPDAKPTDVLVVTTAATNDFQIAAISG
jgi:X-X-X-Leu-X-X-Gly heptad repeat protein